MTLNEYFPAIFVINMARRTDRWDHVLLECAKHQMTVERFEGIDMKNLGNDGCTASHRAVLDIIIKRELPRALIMEDDFEARSPMMQRLFSEMIGEVPADWRMLYLAGHYAEDPIRRVSPHVIRCGHMKTTSSYAVTLESAREMAPWITGAGPIDELYSTWNRKTPTYILQPRLFVQYANYSDLQQREMDNSGCMQDTRHENMV